MIGVVGHNGAGKDYLFPRLLRAVTKTAMGQFLWEGKPMDRKARLKRSYMVMQDVNYELFADSVEAECSFGIRNPDQTLINGGNFGGTGACRIPGTTSKHPFRRSKTTGGCSRQYDLWERPAWYSMNRPVAWTLTVWRRWQG